MSTLSIGRVGVRAQDPWLAVRLYLASPAAAVVEAHAARHRAQAARRPLLWVAVTHSAGAVVSLITLAHLLGQGDPQAQLLAAATVGVAAAFWAVWGWSALAPLPAAVVGLTMYASLSYLAYATLPGWTPATSDGEAWGRAVGCLVGATWVLGTCGLLVRAIVAATRARRAVDPSVPQAGVLPVVGLYLLLLSVVAIPRTLVAEHDLAIGDVLDVMKLMALVTFAGALVGWRSVAAALAGAFDARWLLVGVLGGLGTFAWASIYGDLTSAAFGLPHAAAGNEWVDAGYGWAGAFAALAIFPAVVEELAFRGVIVPRLGRVMTGGETVLVSGAMFAILHLNVTGVPFLLPMGVLLGVLRRRSGSLWPCIAMHLAHNGAVLAAERWM